MRPNLTVLIATLTCIGSGLSAQTTHVIQLQHDAAREEYRFSPADVTARPGDVLVFRVTGGGNHSIVFDDHIPQAARTALSAALPRKVGELTSPLLGPGSEYRITVPSLPAGRYAFYCLPHRAYDESGTLIIR